LDFLASYIGVVLLLKIEGYIWFYFCGISIYCCSGMLFALLGTILFVPGFYYSRIAGYAYKGYKGFSSSNNPAVWKISKTEFFGLQSDLICITWGLVGYLFLGLGFKVTLFDLKIMAKFWKIENLLASSVNERLCKSFPEVFLFLGANSITLYKGYECLLILWKAKKTLGII